MNDRPITPTTLLSPVLALALVAALGACGNQPPKDDGQVSFDELQAIAESSGSP